MVSQSLDFAASFLSAPVFGSWFTAFVALFMVRRLILFIRGLSK